MAYINLSSACKTARANQLSTSIGASGKMLIYTGAAPATPDTAATGTLLVTLPLSATAGTASAGVFTFNAITQTNATASGTAGYARITQSDGVTGVIDLDVGTTGASVTINTTNIVYGGPVAVTSASISEA